METLNLRVTNNLYPTNRTPRVACTGRADLPKTELGEFDRYAREKRKTRSDPRKKKLGKPRERCPQFWPYSTARSAYYHTVTEPVTNITKCLQRSYSVSLSISFTFFLHTPPSPIVHLKPVSLIRCLHSLYVSPEPSESSLPEPAAKSLVSSWEGSPGNLMTDIYPCHRQLQSIRHSDVSI